MSEINNVLDRMVERIRKQERTSRVWPPPECKPLKDWLCAGLRCLLLSGPGSICGYVRVPSEHPFARADYDDVPVEVWWGLTFRCIDTDGFTWFGWDDAHIDKIPHSHVEENEKLARQLRDLSKGVWSEEDEA